jgi:hypothetical protein
MEEESPSPPPELARYVKALDDRVGNYSRFFQALLVKQADHHLFFQDLRAFREQDHVTLLLTTQIEDGSTIKQMYRDCTRHFLASRFAHPWCRNEYGNAKHGFLDTAKARQKRSEAMAKEEERLHKLLVPLWIPFRRRMMPTGEEMAAFLEKERLIVEERQQTLLDRSQQDNALRMLVEEIEHEGVQDNKENSVPVRKLGNEQVQHPDSAYFNAEAYVAEDDDAVYAKPQGNQSSQAAGLFVGLAATSFLANNKRARKYLLKKMKK